MRCWILSEKFVRVFFLLIFFCSIAFVLYETILSRECGEEYKYNYHLFWSYEADDDFVHYYFWQNVWNVVLFMPTGLLLPLAFKCCRWWTALLTGLCLSTTIELLQLVSMRGFSELDDIFHNTLGCIIGFLLMKGMIAVLHEEKHNRKESVVL